MNKSELIKKLYEGENVQNKDVFTACNDYLTPSNIKLLLRKFVACANMLEYNYLKNESKAITQIELGRVAAIFDLINCGILNSKGLTREIPLVAWKREIADFLTETPETIKCIKDDSTLQQNK